MNLYQVEKIETFKLGEKRFFAFRERGGNKVLILSETMGNYGTWMNVENFKKEYNKSGEANCLGQL